jgi:hypothetical protein
MVVAHCDAPVAHAASRVREGNLSEDLFSLFILERMEPCDRAIELLPGLSGTGDEEVDPTKLLGVYVLMLKPRLRSGRRGMTEKDHEESHG